MLNSQGLLLIVDGVELKPEEALAATEWAKRDSSALLIIASNVERAVLERFGVVESSVQAWQHLLSIYKQSSGYRLDRLAEEFFTAKKDAEHDM